MAERDRQPLIIQPDWLGRGLTQNELLLLARLDSYWRNGHRAHPSSEFLAQQIDLHPRTVERALRGLESKEWIYRQTRQRKAGSGGKDRTLFPTNLVGTMGVPDKSDKYLLDNSDGYVPDKSVGIEKESKSKRGRVGANGQGSRLPEPFELTYERLEVARQKGLSRADAGEELEKFCDYWRAQPGQRGRKADWEATWRNWCRNAVAYRQRFNGKGNGDARGEDPFTGAL